MAREVASIIGSGTTPYTYGILPSGSRGIEADGRGERLGTQVILANPEDINSVEAFAVSGITVIGYPTQIISPGTNPLPRCRSVIVENSTPDTTILIAPDSLPSGDIPSHGFALRNSNVDAMGLARIELPLLHNNSIWAYAAGSAAIVRILIY